MSFSPSRIELRIGAAIAATAVVLRIAGVRRTMALIDRAFARAPSRGLSAEEELAFAQRIARHVNIVAARMPLKPRCLVRSMTTALALRRWGVPAEVRIGVALREGFAAHAWIELRGIPINDERAVTDGYRAIWTNRHPPR